MRRAGLELWPADEESWARRAAGEVLCGSSLDLGALRLDCAFFRWHLEGRTGVGRYDILRRAAVRRAAFRAVVSDFGGVLTAPLLEGFALVQEDTGVPPRAFGEALARAGEPEPALRARGGRHHRGRVHRRARARAGADPRARGRPARLRGALHGLARRERRALRLLPRAPRARDPARACARTTCASGSRSGGRSCRSTRSSRRSSTPRSSACASRSRGSTRSCSSGWGSRRPNARSSTTSRRNVEAAAALGFAGVHFEGTEQAIAALDGLLDGR